MIDIKRILVYSDLRLYPLSPVKNLMIYRGDFVDRAVLDRIKLHHRSVHLQRLLHTVHAANFASENNQHVSVFTALLLTDAR